MIPGVCVCVLSINKLSHNRENHVTIIKISYVITLKSNCHFLRLWHHIYVIFNLRTTLENFALNIKAFKKR